MKLRSLMFVPGHREDMLRKAAAAGADVLLPDLEDSVPPALKAEALATVRGAIEGGWFGATPVFVRVNDVSDVTALRDRGVGFMIPKATPEAVRQAAHATGPFYHPLIPLIETCEGLLLVRETCAASPRVVAAAFGSEDFLSDVEGTRTQESLRTPRALVALGARAAGVVPIDTVHTRFRDLAELREELAASKDMGFGGALVLHPMELPVVHEVFTPTAEDVARARDIMLSAEQGAVSRGDAIVGPPMVRQARTVLARARKYGVAP